MLSADELMGDLEHIYKSFRGMGLPLSANLFADIGLKAFAKPDLHVLPIISLIALAEFDEKVAFRALVNLAKKEAEVIDADKDFQWLKNTGGLYPRHLDRIIYLIGSDNFCLDGKKKNRVKAPHRRRLMVEALRNAGIFCSMYFAIGAQ